MIDRIVASLGSELVVQTSNRMPSSVFMQCTGSHFRADQLPEVVAALYLAAGQAPPSEPTHTYADDHGDTLDVRPARHRDNTAWIDSQGVYVTVDDLPGIVNGLYRAVGAEPPTLLAPSDSDWSDNVWKWNGLTAGRVGGQIEVNGRRLDSADALRLAGALVVMAQAAANEPPAEAVEELCELIYQSGATHDSETWAGSRVQDLARALLKAGITLPTEETK